MRLMQSCDAPQALDSGAQSAIWAQLAHVLQSPELSQDPPPLVTLGPALVLGPEVVVDPPEVTDVVAFGGGWQ